MIEKLTSNKSKIFVLLVILFILGLTIIIGWVAAKNYQPKVNNTQNSNKSIMVLDKKLSLVNCDKAKLLLKEKLSGDICYIGNFTIGGEKITYIKVNASKHYLEEIDKNCKMDCGGGISISSSENIIRANGTIEYASVDWASQLESPIYYLTGCGTDKFFQFDSLKNQGKFIKNKDKIAVASSLKNIEITDAYGNLCTIDASFISYTAEASQSIQELAVHYQLQDINSCTQQSELEGCYTAQATMRNDLQLCDKAVDTQYPSDGSDYCIESMAKRRLDTALCEKLNLSRSVCQHDTQELKGIFHGTLVIN
ncbi:MAG: hypothetical protein Q7T74_07225 [Candidatus Saccharibacteria bacterium]|nr:hypothetical protein [Candidatus Saccharibacteria bacterium]